MRSRAWKRKHGGDRESDRVANLATRFTASTAEATGKLERSIQRVAARGEALGDDLSEVAGSLFARHQQGRHQQRRQLHR